MIDRTCPTCGDTTNETPGTVFNAWELPLCRKPSCRNARYLPRDLLITEVEHLIGSDKPSRIARRLGMSSAGLHRRLTRADRSDLARHFPQTERRAA